MARERQAVIDGRMEGAPGMGMQLDKQLLAAACELAGDPESFPERNIKMQRAGALVGHDETSHESLVAAVGPGPQNDGLAAPVTQ